MESGELALAKIKHQTWRLRLRSFLLGSNGVREAEFTSPQECALGKWIYTIGVAKYGNHPEMRQLEQEHVRIHQMAEELVRLRGNHSNQEAMRQFPVLHALSDHIIDLIDRIGSESDTPSH